ncbi:MAG: PD40 domain-containing protein [Anaerolineae bacterium]|nr:PD40 domain-containing protein [Anaerolineae bacterium]
MRKIFSSLGSLLGIVVLIVFVIALAFIFRSRGGETVAWQQPSASTPVPSIGNVRMSDAPGGPAVINFPSRTSAVYLVFEYAQVQDTPIVVRTYDNVGNVLFEQTQNYSGSGVETIGVVSRADVFADGRYVTNIYVGSELFVVKTLMWAVGEELPTPAPTPVPTDTPTVTPAVPGTPTAVPTPAGPLPPGPKVVYKEYLQGAITLWAASAVNPELRRILTMIDDPSQFGVQVNLSYDETKIAYTALPPRRGYNHFAAELYLASLDGSQHRMLASQVDIGGFVNYPIWSPDDRSIAFRRQTAEDPPYTQMIAMVNVETGEERTLVSADDTTWLWPLDWSPDGRYLYYIRGTVHSELWRVDITQGNTTEYVQLIWEGAAPRCYFLSPDGQWLLCTVLEARNPPRYAVILVPTGPGQVEIIITGASDELYNPIWHPSGQEVTVNLPPQANEQAELRTINVQTRHERAIAFAEERIFVPRAWSPDGQWVAVQKFPGTNRDLLLIRHNGAQVHRISTPGGLEFIGWLSNDLLGEEH